MRKPFDMELFLSGVLTGSKSVEQRHIRQAKIMQAAVRQRWHRENPWTWQYKHFFWFLTQHLKMRAKDTRYYYYLTVLLIRKRLGAKRQMRINIESSDPRLGRAPRTGKSMTNHQ